MKAKKHPEYQKEAQKLRTAYEAIERKIEELQPPVQAADQRAAVAALQPILEKIDKLERARSEPYKARVDWIGTNGIPETFYLGKVEFSEESIFSWRSKVADIYYLGKWEEPGRRLLKRSFSVSGPRLNRISDEFVDPERTKLMGLDIGVSAVDSQLGDKVLADLLKKTPKGELHEIIATIQKEQYEIISALPDQALIIQGVAGAGKTEIALHRLAYLLYQGGQRKGFARDKVLFLAPSPLFLHHVERVLPELGERGVPQMTFDRWMFKQLGVQLDYVPEEDALERLLDEDTPEPIRLMHYRNARHLGSIEIKKLLDRYVIYLFQEIIKNLGVFRFSPSAQYTHIVDLPDIEWQPEDVYGVFEKSCLQKENKRNLNNCKTTLQTQLISIIRTKINDALQSIREYGLRDTIRNDTMASVEESLSEYFKLWEKINVSRAYRRLFRNADLLQKMGEGIFTRWDLELLHLDAPKQGTPFRFSDLGGLLYLHILLNGIEDKEILDHIVIDEAQDISQMQFFVITQFSRNQSMTIMGDLGQRIYVDLGLQSWDDIRSFIGNTLAYHTLRRSYRSTQNIINYASQLLERIGAKEEIRPIPLVREGEEVETIHFDNQTERVVSINQLIQRERDKGRKSIAIVAKTAKAGRELANQFKKQGIDDIQLILNHDEAYLGGVVIIPGYLTKGLEFDVVIISDADDQSYRTELLDARLIYVAMTRASHKLYIGWIGNMTSLLEKQTSITLQDSYEAHLKPRLVVIEDAIRQISPQRDPDTCVERLASAGKLYLLDNGALDATTLAVFAYGWEQTASEEEKAAEELDAQVVEAIVAQVKQYSDLGDLQIQNALALLQSTYGLLRVVMRNLGITTSDEKSPEMQTVALARFLNAIRTQKLTYTVSNPTTERKVLDFVASHREAEARELLHLLIEWGIIEKFQHKNGERIRVAHEWIESLLLASLGHEPVDLDAELRENLPRFPTTISQQVLESDFSPSPSTK